MTQQYPTHLRLLLARMPNFVSEDAYHVRVWTRAGIVFEGAVQQGTDRDWLALDLHTGLLQGCVMQEDRVLKGQPEDDSACLVFISASDILTVQIIP
jgi:hypothetical protein